MEIIGIQMIFKFEKNCHKFFLKSKTKNYIVCVAIGKKHYNDWKKYSSELWLKYCKKNGLGIIVIYKNLISKKIIIGSLLLGKDY